MKLLFVLEHYHPYIGGAETLFTTLCESLAQNGHEIRVITTRYRPDLPAEEALNGVIVERINCRNRFLFSALALPAVIKWAGWADLVHTTTYNAAFPAWVGAKFRGTKTVITFHEYWGALWNKLPFLSSTAAWVYRAYERFILALPFDNYVAVSNFTALALVRGGVASDRVRRIYNGLDYTRYEGSELQAPDLFTYTYFGRLGVSKGLDLIIPAAAEFRKTYPKSKLRLIIPKGPAGMYRNILAMIDHEGIGEYVELLHELPEAELRSAVNTSSCVLITSYSEGFCFVAAETAAAGIPIISSGRGALVETVSGPHLTMQEMSVPALVQCLTRAYRSEWDETPLKRFPLRESIDQYLEFYAEITA
ncbi:glycosyltransferase family 4 protein [Lewinella sp. 4G2]|uniref:glycosyltransferase family 4 protein n=1 Tax=Lewinella sp. 4G2 TaxID=1803372 RepID=UPI0007B4C780|nr:glycosyltransferase family 4 protein [Lewinella sp. 4G2]OAV44843.1 hypothetical protein A3850_010225 [Lewinella sp. 4G2]